MAYVVIILVAALIGLGVWYSYHRKQQRRQALASFADRFGLDYSVNDVFGMVDFDFHLLRMGVGRGCENVLYGMWKGLPIKEADYWYYDESTDSKGNTSKSYHYFSIVVAELAAELPEVSIQKESVFSKLVDHLGFHDIQFESEDFNRHFQVKSPDQEFAFKLVDARMMQWLLSTEGAFGFETNGRNLLVWCHRSKPTELVPLIGSAKGFTDHLPKLVWSEYGPTRSEAEPGTPAEAQTEGGTIS